VFHDPKAALSGGFPSECKKSPGTPNQEISKPLLAPARGLTSVLERALARFGAVIAAKNGIEQESAGAS
jgi:hypothetical protein